MKEEITKGLVLLDKRKKLLEDEIDDAINRFCYETGVEREKVFFNEEGFKVVVEV